MTSGAQLPTTALARDVPTNPGAARKPYLDESGCTADGAVVFAFETLLKATCTLTGVSLRGVDAKVSPSQMFEAPVGGAAEQRLATLTEDDRADRLVAPRGGRNDPTSVDARLASRDVKHGGLTAPAETTARDSCGSRPAPKPSPGALEGPVDGRSAADESSALRANGRQSGRADTEPAPRPTFEGRSNNADIRPAAGPAGATTAPTSETAQASGRQGGTMAQQVARILGAACGGEAEPVRPAAASPGAAAAQSSAGRQKGAGRTASNQPAASRSSTGASGETDLTRRPEFGQLVRSIRLQLGSRHSTARLHLEPPRLGRVLVEVRMAGDELRIGVRTETPEARDLLLQRAEQLRGALAQHGVNVEWFDVTTDSSDGKSSDSLWADDSGPAEREGRGQHTGRSSGDDSLSSSEDTGTSAEAVDAPVAAAVAEARLDIRV